MLWKNIGSTRNSVWLCVKAAIRSICSPYEENCTQMEHPHSIPLIYIFSMISVRYFKCTCCCHSFQMNEDLRPATVNRIYKRIICLHNNILFTLEIKLIAYQQKQEKKKKIENFCFRVSLCSDIRRQKPMMMLSTK